MLTALPVGCETAKGNRLMFATSSVSAEHRSEVIPLSSGVAELELLLPLDEIEELEAAAHSRGVTTGQILRGLIREFLLNQRYIQSFDPD
jgi:hypothetical protein